MEIDNFQTEPESDSDWWSLYPIMVKVIPEDLNFDEIDIAKDCQTRQMKYNSLPEVEKNAIETMLLKLSKDQKEGFLRLFQVTGRETDETFVDEIEKKYKTEAKELRLSCLVFKTTYGMWQVNKILRDSRDMESDKAQIESWLEDIQEAGRKLSQMETKATHCTNYENLDEINKSNQLHKSVGIKQYEGDGVYVGLMGSYREWAEKIYEFNIKMKDTLPIIVSFNYPKMMANVICRYLDIPSDKDDYAKPNGIEWLHRNLENSPSQMQINLLEKYLGEIYQYTDSDGLNRFVTTTKEEPIVWSVLARSLRFRNLIHENDLLMHEEERQDSSSDQMILPLGTAIRLKGVTLAELEEEI